MIEKLEESVRDLIDESNDLNIILTQDKGIQ